MASPEVLDFDPLLAPISGDNPAGIALREDFSPTAIYHQVKEARNKAREAERAALGGEEEGTRLDPPDWGPVERLCKQVLAEESKDLEIAAWLTESLLRREGFPGLRDAFRLIREMCERFWENIYPLPEEDGMADRVFPLTGLNDSPTVLVIPIKNLPLTAEGSFRALTLADYQQAGELQTMEDAEKRAQRIDEGAASMQMFDTAVAETPADYFRNLLEDVDQCRDEFDKLCQVLDEKCGTDESGYPLSPPSSGIRETLQETRDTIYNLAKHLLVEEEEEAAEEGGEGAPGEGGAAVAGGPVKNRDAAFRTLLQVAEFFRRTEPHSPISYALEQAVRWGKLPLPQLLSELIPDAASRDHLFTLVGMKPPEEGE